MIRIVQCQIVYLQDDFNMKKISISLSGHQTSISLEEEFIDALNQIAKHDNVSLASIINEIDEKREPGSNLSSAVRSYILRRYTQSAKL